MAKKLQSNKKGLSAVVVTLMLILLSIVAVGLVWTFVSNVLNKQISSSEACVGNVDKVKLEPHYTCWEPGANGNPSAVRVSLSLGDVDVDKVIISISSADKIQSYTITNTLSNVDGLKPVPYSSGSTQVVLPLKNSGLTYNATGFSSEIDSIKIAPVIKGNQCDVSDTLTQIENCQLIV